MSRSRLFTLAGLVLACRDPSPADATSDGSSSSTEVAATSELPTTGATTGVDTTGVATTGTATTGTATTGVDTTGVTTGEPELCGVPVPCPGGACTGLLRGASERTTPLDLALDPCGDILVTGTHAGPEPGLGLGPVQGETDAFVARLDRTGARRWGRSFGEPDNQNEYDVAPTAIAVHPDGSIFVAGSGSSPFVVDDLACDGYAAKAFVLKLAPDGEPVWLRCHEDPPVRRVADALVVDDHVYLAGECHDPQDFETSYMYLARVDAITGSMDASACLGSGGHASFRRLARDGERLVVLGAFQGLLLFTQPLSTTDGDLVLARFDPSAWKPGETPPWDFSAQYGGPGPILADGLARADDGALAVVAWATPQVACDDGDGLAGDLGEYDSRALLAVFTPDDGGYARTTSVCFGRNVSNEGFDVSARPDGGFTWTGYSYGEIFAPPHRLTPASPAAFVATWVDGAGVTATWMPEIDDDDSAYYTRLATDPLGLVVTGAYHGDPAFFPGDDAPAVGQRLFVLQTAADLTFEP